MYTQIDTSTQTARQKLMGTCLACVLLLQDTGSAKELCLGRGAVLNTGFQKRLVEVLLMQRPEGRGDPSWQHKVPFPDTFTAPCCCGWRCGFPLLLGPLNPYLTAWYTALLVGRSSALAVSVRVFPSHTGRWRMDGDHQGATLAPAASLALGESSSASQVPGSSFCL